VTLCAIGIALRAGYEAHQATPSRGAAGNAPQILTAPPRGAPRDDDDEDDDDD
jgi:hypothetical protein